MSDTMARGRGEMEPAAVPYLTAIKDRLVGCTADLQWFAVCTRSRQEKVAAETIGSLGVANYLPLKTESRQWSDRKQKVTTPLFSGYLFVRMNLLDCSKLRVLKVPGVAGFVRNSSGPLPIPDYQVEAVRAVVGQGMECAVHSLLEEGDLVRVVRGALNGVEGRLIRFNSESRLVISIEILHRSLSVCISCNDVEPVHSCCA